MIYTLKKNIYKIISFTRYLNKQKDYAFIYFI